METTMDIDDFKQAWQTLDRRLEQQHEMQLNLFRDTKLSKVRSGLRLLRTGQAIQIACGAILMLLFAPFWVEHLDVLHLVAYGVLLHAYGLMFVLFGARSLHLISCIDYAAPVLEIQKQLESLRVWNLRSAIWFGITGCFIWVPLMLVIFYWLGADIWVHEPQVVGWLVVSSAVALAAMFGIVAALRHPSLSRLKQSLDEDAAGRSVRRAQAVLDEIKQFERT